MKFWYLFKAYAMIEFRDMQRFYVESVFEHRCSCATVVT